MLPYKLSEFIDRNARPFLDLVAANPGLYNPLLLTGFCGKTHAACGVLNAIAENAPSKKVHWVSAERFIMECIYCRERGRSEDFYSFYMSFDALYVEAINRFTENQEAAEAAAKIFEHFLHERKQVIACSWEGIDEGFPLFLLPIVSKGATLHLEHPCVEDLRLIAEKKAKDASVSFPLDVREYLVRACRNVRELEGRIDRYARTGSVEIFV